MRMTQLERDTIGEEPTFTDGGSYSEILRAYNWYAYFYTVAEAREFVVEYMIQENFSGEDIRDFKKIKDDKIGLTLCSSCRMTMNGANLDYNIPTQIKYLLHTFRNTKEETNVVRWPFNKLITAIEGTLDIFYLSGYKGKFDTSINDFIKNASQGEIKEAITYYQPLLNELKSNDAYTKEAYDHLPREQKNNYVRFMESIISALQVGKVSTKRTVTRKPRKKKEKSAEQVSRKVKYQVSDKDLNVVSLSPDKIVGATQIWLYNTKTRKLAKYIASANKTLSIKGTTLLNFDEKASVQKTIRKPKDIVPSVMTEAKVPLNKAFDKIKARAQAVNGRINGFTLILRTIK